MVVNWLYFLTLKTNLYEICIFVHIDLRLMCVVLLFMILFAALWYQLLNNTLDPITCEILLAVMRLTCLHYFLTLCNLIFSNIMCSNLLEMNITKHYKGSVKQNLNLCKFSKRNAIYFIGIYEQLKIIYKWKASNFQIQYYSKR